MSSAITDLNCGGCGLTAVTPATVSDVGQGLFLGSTRENKMLEFQVSIHIIKTCSVIPRKG